MIIKTLGDKSQDIQALNTLLQHPQLDQSRRQKIIQQIKNIEIGFKAEKAAAYQIDFHLKKSENWAVLHDIRFEYGGRVAQIDHLLINRLMEIWVCESKYWANGISINEYGEFTSFYGNREIGIASPLEQNRNHVTLLTDMIKNETGLLPQRFGLMPIRPNFFNAVLVSTNAKINRPQVKFDGMDNIFKVDQFVSHVIDKHNRKTTSLLKAVRSETVESFSTKLAAAHKPKIRNWAANFGLTNLSQKVESQSFEEVSPSEFDQTLFSRLKAKRIEIARSLGKPAFVIFSDATLKDMVKKHPTNPEEFLRVSGVGKVKYEQFGPMFLEVLLKR